MQCIHGGGDNSAHQNALTDSVQSDAHQPDIRAKTVLTAFSKHGQHTGNILHFTTGIRFSTAVPAVFAGTERKKTGCRMLTVNTHGFATGDDFQSGIPLKTEDKSENRCDVVVTG